MSWFRHTPPKHPPLPKTHPHPFHSSPMAEKLLNESKEQVRAPSKKSKK